MAQKKIRDLAAVPEILGEYYLVVETPEGTKQTLFSEFCKNIFAADITESKAEFPEIGKNDTLPVIVGKLKKWQADTIAKIEAGATQENIISEFPEIGEGEEGEAAKEALKEKIASGYLAYIMNQSLTKAIKDNADLLNDYEVMKREIMAPYGYFGIEWGLDDLMALVKAGSWDKFAVGDYFIETTSSGEKIMWEVAGKNSYLHCGDTELNKNHIVCCPRDCLETYYKFNTSHTNAGGYAASLMPANLETEANKFSSKLQGYMTTIRRLENNKGTWAWASRRIFLPGIVELCGSNGFADGYSGGAFNQLQLFTGGNAHILKGAGFNKKKAGRFYFWTADPSAANTTNFCAFTSNGYSNNYGAADDLALAPLIVLS